MNWTLVLSIVILLLQALILGFWKPWLGAYGKEKGKNIAPKGRSGRNSHGGARSHKGSKRD